MIHLKNILIIDKMHLSIIPMLESLGLKVDYMPDISREKVMACIAPYEALVMRSKTVIDKEILDKAAALKLIARAGAGLDLVDLAQMKARGIHLINAPEGNRDALAEHTMGLLLCLLNNIHMANTQVKSGLWDREGNRGVELKTKTVGLLGFGYMGRAFAQRLSAFGCRIMAFDKYKTSYYNESVRMCSMEDIFLEADILSLHVPLKEETFGMIDEEFISRFKKPFYLLNTARGELMSLEVLKKAMESGRIIGAGLDVLENEKLNTFTPAQKAAFDYLCASDRVIMTPHVAGWTHESYLKINEVLVSKIRNYLAEQADPEF